MMVREEKSKNRITLGQDGNALVNLIIVNAIVFVILKFILVIYMLSDFDKTAYDRVIFKWFTLPADLRQLSLRPWVVVLHMFTHYSVFAFVGNMLWLWCFGYILQDMTGNRKMVPIYIYGGFAGAFFFVLSSHIFPGLQSSIATSTLFGANAAIMAVAVATTTLAPDYKIFPLINGGIPLWVLTLVYAILTFGFLPERLPSLYISLLAGAGTGFLFIYQLRKGYDWSEWMNKFFDWVQNLFDPDKKQAAVKTKDQYFYKVKDSQPYKKTPNVTQKRIDDILDKINQKGFHFLTDEEKDILKRAAKGDD